LQSDNFNMYDLIAYRNKHMAHPHAGDKCCVYPSYDYTHYLRVSFANMLVLCSVCRTTT
jgi:glutaminyl-tRNA synthetase